jgi:hypothetical protein
MAARPKVENASKSLFQAATQRQTTDKDKIMQTDDEIEQRVAIRKREALEIDPETAEIHWCYGWIGDPYGECPDFRECVGRQYFARRPGSDIWVSFSDLPMRTRERIREKSARECSASQISTSCENAG